MQGLDAHYAAQLDRYQAQIDKQDYKDLEREEIELEAEAEFERIAKSCNMSAPMPETDIPVFELVNGKYVETGTRPLEFGELIYECMDNKDCANHLLRALFLCAAKGNVEAVEAVSEIKDLYVKERADKKLEREE
jgi:hypothetical protein